MNMVSREMERVTLEIEQGSLDILPKGGIFVAGEMKKKGCKVSSFELLSAFLSW